MGLSVAVFLVVSGAERSRFQDDFVSVASDRAHAIRAGMSEDFIELDLLKSYVEASEELEQGNLGSFAAEFRKFAGSIPAQETDTQVIAFAPRVPGASRAGFEAAVRRDVSSGFAIRELGEGGVVRSAGSRSEYYPAVAVVPEAAAGLEGFDLSTVPAFQQAMAHAAESGRITASAVVTMPSFTAGAPAAWHFLPLRSGGSASGAAGYAVSSFRIDQMVELSLKDLEPIGINLELVDPEAPAGQQILYYHRSRAQEAGTPAASKTGMSFTTTIEAGERTWVLNAYPTAAFFSRHRSWQSWSILAAGLFLTALGGIYFAGRLRRVARIEALVAERTDALSRELENHRRLEGALEASQTTLSSRVEQLDRRNREIQLLNEVGDMLQACLATEEAYPVISLHAPRLLPGTAGVLYMHDPSKDVYGATAEWGESPPSAAAFKAEDCWALRRGRVHAVSASSATLPCGHDPGERSRGSLCIPLTAIGRTIGLLHVTGSSGESQDFALSMAEHVGMALANLMLRSDLRQLSIHDPLTGLHNRRYMEEALELELRRAERKAHSVGVIMLDIDHFKAFNDGFGHAAGDELLRAIGALLQANLRAGDIACRFGGEEFVLILPEASAEAAAQKAEKLRELVKALEVRYLDAPLGPVTVSLGVAVFPGHGRTRDDILMASDAALYLAKEGGRNRVVAAGAA